MITDADWYAPSPPPADVEYRSAVGRYPVLGAGALAGALLFGYEKGPIPMSQTDHLLAQVQHLEARLRQEQQSIQAIIDHFPAVIYIRDRDGRFTRVNHHHARILNRTPEEIVGQRDYDLFPTAVVDAFRANDRQIFESGQTLDFPEQVPQDDGVHTYRSIKFPVRDADGHIIGIGGISIDITDQQQIIETQREALRELSTPLIPLTDHVVIMPLIGTIDSQRARMVLEALLNGVAQHQAELVIIDITGVSVVDTQVAQALISAAQALKLLGAQVMLTGIQPSIAQTLVALDVDLRGIVTQGTLQAGIAVALRRLRTTGSDPAGAEAPKG
jgi:rsbT co-antagonist protein RsbR